MKRTLAAILAADVAGKSRLMGEDEAGTLTALKVPRSEIVDPRIAAHRGRILKTTDDGLQAKAHKSIRHAIELDPNASIKKVTSPRDGAVQECRRLGEISRASAQASLL